MGVNSLPKTVTRQRRGCDLNTGLSAPESSTLTNRLPSYPMGATENAGFHAKVQRNLGLDFVTKQHKSLQKLQPVYSLV